SRHLVDEVIRQSPAREGIAVELRRALDQREVPHALQVEGSQPLDRDRRTARLLANLKSRALRTSSVLTHLDRDRVVAIVERARTRDPYQEPLAVGFPHQPDARWVLFAHC